MPSFPGLLRGLRYTNSNVTERTAQAAQAGVQQTASRFDVERHSANVYAAPRMARSLSVDDRRSGCRRAAEVVDRRVLCRRILRQPVMVEFRSGAGRRRRHLREDDMLVHVSIKI